MVETLAELEAGTLSPVPQDHSRATLAPILTRENGRVNWNNSAQQIYDRWRGFQPWPGAFTLFREKKLSLPAVQIVGRANLAPVAPGILVRDEGRLLASCGRGSWLQLIEVQLEGKRRMPADDFLNGIALAPGDRLS